MNGRSICPGFTFQPVRPSLGPEVAGCADCKTDRCLCAANPGAPKVMATWWLTGQRTTHVENGTGALNLHMSYRYRVFRRGFQTAPVSDIRFSSVIRFIRAQSVSCASVDLTCSVDTSNTHGDGEEDVRDRGAPSSELRVHPSPLLELGCHRTRPRARVRVSLRAEPDPHASHTQATFRRAEAGERKAGDEKSKLDILGAR